jgi:hypothetical protein
MVRNGDLDRLVGIARVIASAQDALTDDMVGRLSGTVGQGFSLLDRLNRCGIDRMVAMLERLEAAGSLERLAQTLPKLLDRMEHFGQLFVALDQASEEMQHGKPASGGFGGMWRMLGEKDNQEILRFMFAWAKRLRAEDANLK